MTSRELRILQYIDDCSRSYRQIIVNKHDFSEFIFIII